MGFFLKGFPIIGLNNRNFPTAALLMTSPVYFWANAWFWSNNNYSDNNYDNNIDLQVLEHHFKAEHQVVSRADRNNTMSNTSVGNGKNR